MYYNFSPDLAEPLNVVHPIQLKALKKLISSKIPEGIDYIFLFGSSLELACGMQSDIDLMVITEEYDHELVYGKMKELCRDIGKKCDILISSKGDFLHELDEIGTVPYRMKELGVCIYAKE